MPVLLPGKSHGQRSLVGYSPWGHKESDMTEQLHFLSWRRKWQPTPGLLPGKPHGQRSLAGYSPWGRKGLAKAQHPAIQPARGIKGLKTKANQPKLVISFLKRGRGSQAHLPVVWGWRGLRCVLTVRPADRRPTSGSQERKTPFSPGRSSHSGLYSVRRSGAAALKIFSMLRANPVELRAPSGKGQLNRLVTQRRVSEPAAVGQE